MDVLGEEAQGVFSSNSLRRKSCEWLAKTMSVSANCGFSWLVVGRIPSEISTQIFEHSTIKLISNSTQSNSIRKLKQVFSWESIEGIKTFDKGKFYLKTRLYEGNDLIMLETQIVEVKHGLEGFVSRVKQAMSKLLGRSHISTSNSSKSGMSK